MRKQAMNNYAFRADMVLRCIGPHALSESFMTLHLLYFSVILPDFNYEQLKSISKMYFFPNACVKEYFSLNFKEINALIKTY